MEKFITIAAMLVSCSMFAAGISVTPKAQLTYGFGDAHEYINPAIGGGVIAGYTVMENLDVELDVSYNYWLDDEDKAGDVTIWTVPVLAGAKYRVHDMVSVIAGGGLNFYNIDGDNVDVSETDYSFYAGAEFNYDNIVLRPKYLFTTGDEENSNTVMIEAGYRFNF